MRLAGFVTLCGRRTRRGAEASADTLWWNSVADDVHPVLAQGAHEQSARRSKGVQRERQLPQIVRPMIDTYCQHGTANANMPANSPCWCDRNSRTVSPSKAPQSTKVTSAGRLARMSAGK